jgi:tRNA pseudouridine55 synthase
VNRAGFVVIDKPPGITSHDVVSTLRAVTGVKKIGHTGTLDPFATGVLPLAIGRCTRLIQFLDERSKVYEATVSLGCSMDTGDPTGTLKDTQPVPVLTAGAVGDVLAGFLGERMQRPPAYSAVKVKGKRLYKYAREGTPVLAEPRPILIKALELTGLTEQTLSVRVTCSRGTYVRVLAEEIAEALGTVGHLATLRRSQSGPFQLEHALSFSAIAKMVAGREDWPAVLRPPRGAERVPWISMDEIWEQLAGWLQPPAEALAHLPAVDLTPDQLDQLRRFGVTPPPPAGLELGDLFVITEAGSFVGVLRREAEGVKVARMFALG